MATLREFLEDEDNYVSEDCLEILIKELSNEEADKDLSPGAASQVAQLVIQLDRLDSQDTNLYQKIEQLKKERKKLEEKKTKILKSLHYQLKPAKVETDGTKTPKKVSSLNFTDFLKPLILKKD